MVPDPEPYIGWMESLSAASVPDLARHAAPEIRFADPFQDVTGLAAVERVYAAIFRHCRDPRFTVLDRAWSGQAWYLRFRFTARSTAGADLSFDGVSELRFDAAGRVILHHDHWDSGGAFYGRLPLLGRVIGWIRGRVAKA